MKEVTIYQNGKLRCIVPADEVEALRLLFAELYPGDIFKYEKEVRK